MPSKVLAARYSTSSDYIVRYRSDSISLEGLDHNGKSRVSTGSRLNRQLVALGATDHITFHVLGLVALIQRDFESAVVLYAIYRDRWENGTVYK